MEPISILVAAAHFAAECHKEGKRKADNSPYVNHPLAVASLLESVGGVRDAEILAAAMLHDVLEDTPATEEDIRRQFGDRVARIVAEVSDDRSLSQVERKQLQVENAPHKSSEAKLVKLADKLHNMTDLTRQTPASWSRELVQGYFVWGKAVIDGMRGTNEALEQQLDKLFATVFPYQGNWYPVLPEEGGAEALKYYYQQLEKELGLYLVIWPRAEQHLIYDFSWRKSYYTSFLAVAGSEEEARCLYPSGYANSRFDRYRNAWYHINKYTLGRDYSELQHHEWVRTEKQLDKLQVRCIGRAGPDQKRGVLYANYRGPPTARTSN